MGTAVRQRENFVTALQKEDVRPIDVHLFRRAFGEIAFGKRAREVLRQFFVRVRAVIHADALAVRESPTQISACEHNPVTSPGQRPAESTASAFTGEARAGVQSRCRKIQQTVKRADSLWLAVRVAPIRQTT